ncbi:hypothetical protein HDV04_002432 [Boothiomyces sp. JEL0838]|nr:hypothetical protein HDV04_002432 [Boothiomyces sp. JEL0838]
MKNSTALIKKTKKTLSNTKLLELQEQNDHIENRKQLFLQKFHTKLQTNNEESITKLTVVPEVQGDVNRRKSTLWELSDNKEMEIESIPILDEFGSQAGQKVERTFANEPPIFYRDSETPFKVQSPVPFSSRSDCTNNSEGVSDNSDSLVEDDELDVVCSKSVPKDKEDSDLKIIDVRNDTFIHQELVNSIQSYIDEKRKALQNHIHSLKSKFQMWVDEIEKQFKESPNTLGMEAIKDFEHKNNASTQTDANLLDFADISIVECLPDEDEISHSCSEKEDPSLFIHDYNPTCGEPAVVDYSPTLPDVVFETVALKGKCTQDTYSQHSRISVDIKNYSKNVIVSLDSIDIPPIVRNIAFSKVINSEYIPELPTLGITTSSLVNIPPAPPKLGMCDISTVDFPPRENVDCGTSYSQQIDDQEIILKPKNCNLGYDTEPSIKQCQQIIDLEASFRYEEMSFESFEDPIPIEKPSQVDIQPKDAFAQELGEISQIYPKERYSDSDVSGIEEILSDGSNSPLLDRIPVELSLNSDDEPELKNEYIETKESISQEQIDSNISIKRSGGFYDEVGLISQGAFTQVETQAHVYSPNKKLKLEFEWSDDGLSDGGNFSICSGDEDLSVIPCTQFRAPEPVKVKPSVLFKPQIQKKAISDSGNSPPNYSAMSIGELKKLADGYGLKSNTGKQYLVEKLTEIWVVLNTNPPNSPQRVTASPQKMKSSPVKGSPMKSQKKVQFQSFDDLLMAHFKNDIELNNRVICFEPLKFEELYQSLLFVPLLETLPRKVLSSFLDKNGINYIAE